MNRILVMIRMITQESIYKPMNLEKKLSKASSKTKKVIVRYLSEDADKTYCASSVLSSKNLSV